ncbi:hypothetical protein KCU77_g181, partial [Aureobasidium melanogenum]
MPPDKDPYKILELQPGASKSEIKKAYHDAGRKHHPDHNEHPDSTQRMQDINYTYEILSDPEKRKQYDQTNQKADSNQGYCASCSGGECTHGFNFKPARPIPKQVCHWCRDGNMLLQTNLCTQHLWCSRCFILRYTLASSDARCCEQMVGHAEVRWRLPAPVAALYDFKRACNFEPLRQPKPYDDLSRTVRDWQETNPSLAYGLAASYALTEKRKEINRLQEQLADCKQTNEELKKQHADPQSKLKFPQAYVDLEASLARAQTELKCQRPIIRRLEEELKTAKAAAKPVSAQSESKLKDDIILKNMRIKELERSTKTAKDANARNIQASSEAQTARKAAVDSEAVARKENERLIAELAAALSEVEQLRQDPARNSIDSRDEPVPAAAEDTATEKRNKDLAAELAKLQQDLQDQRQALTDRDANFAKCQAELSEAQSAREMAIQNDAATQKRCEDLETELAKVKLDLQTQQQAVTEIEARYQAELPAAPAEMKTATGKEDVAKQELENTKARLAQAQEEKTFAQTSSSFLQHRTSMLEKKPHHDGNGQRSETKNGTSHQGEVPPSVAPPQIKTSLLERLKAAQQKIPEQSGPPSSSTPLKASPPSSVKNTSSPHAPVTPTPAPRDAARPVTAAVASSASIPLPTKPSKSPPVTINAPVNVPTPDTAKETLSGAGSTEHQSSQKGATEFQTRPFDLAAWQKDLAASKPSFSFDFSKTNNPVNNEGTKPDNTSKPVLPAKMTEDKTILQPPSQTEQPTLRAKKTDDRPKTDDKPKTPTSLLKGQLHYAKATQKASEEDARRATEEILQLRAELKRHRQFEFDVYHEIARANEMYGSLERKLAKAKKQPGQREERSEGAIKIPADQFAHSVDDNDKSTTELLARLNEDFAPMQAEIKKSLTARKKIEKEESSLKISARTNRRIRDTIRQKDLEIEDMRINYGKKWASLLNNVCAKESEIRRLKKTLHIRKSRSDGQASIGAVDQLLMSEKDPRSLGEKDMESIAAKEPEIRPLDKTLHARCSSESSIDAPNPPPLSVTAKESKVRRLKTTLRTPKSNSSSEARIDTVDQRPSSVTAKESEIRRPEKTQPTPKSSRKIDRTIENYRKNKKEREIYQKIRADRSKFGASRQQVEHLRNQPKYVMIDALEYSKVVAEFLRFDTALTKEIERLSKQPKYVRKVKTRAARPRVNFDTNSSQERC